MGEWISVEDRMPSKRGWYLVHFVDTSKAHIRADGDSYTNDMKVAYFRGNVFPYDNRYHKVDYWTSLPALPGKMQMQIEVE